MAFGIVQKTKEGAREVTYYNDYTTTNLYVELTFGNNVNTLTLTNDSGTDTVQVSYDGATLDGDLKAGESLTLRTNNKQSVYVKASTGGGNVRIWGW